MTALDLDKSPSLQLLKKILTSEDSALIEGLWSAPKAAITSFLSEKTIVFITGASKEDRLFDNLSYFGKTPLEFPSWETFPGENIPPSPDIVGKRFQTLCEILHNPSPKIILCTLQSLLQKLPSSKSLSPLFSTWKVGQNLSFSSAVTTLEALHYKRCSVVADKGEFSLRGGIIDLFPPSSTDPYRVEFFEDRIESIRLFDPVGQKSFEKGKEILLTPAEEKTLFEQEKELFTLKDYLEEETLFILDDLLSLEDQYVSIKNLPKVHSSHFLSLQDFLRQVKKKLFLTEQPVDSLSSIQTHKKERFSQEITFSIFNEPIKTKRWFSPFIKPLEFFSSTEREGSLFDIIDTKDHPRLHLLFLSNSEKEEEILEEKAKEKELKNLSFKKGYLSEGMIISDLFLGVIPYTEISKRAKVRRQKWRNTYHTPAAEFHQLAPGDLVVHYHSGIGKYLGNEKQKNHLGHETEFMVISYAQNSKLYVPLSQSYLVSRYIGSKEEAPTLSALGSKKWQTAKLQAQKQIIGYAADLLDHYAEREIVGGFCYPEDSDDFTLFEEDFPYEETPDQRQAIESIKQDMCSKKAMDRLICGDVGYGKTEVAMRGAAKAVFDGKKQVAVLVPTTVLAMQHYESFKQRMENFSLNIEILSRFCSSKQIKETIKKVEQGEVDIIIGTHRLLSNDVKFKNLGLIIIDEEQRFGVRAKEHLKTLKKGVDCLTLSATPIPRTLYLSLVSVRDLSVINTPPQDRLPVKTILAENDPELIEQAILRELLRQGQIFFIHNRVESIFRRADQIQKLIPKAKIAVVHGQMDVEAIDEAFHQFKQGETDILFSTTIVENGIDIPNANTILVDRSDSFGLADLYQLRGRVGRWNRTAYAYFLTPTNQKLSEVSRKRLQALLESSGGYGGGMKLAMRDLEIRGAGDILGVQQSGQVATIGFHLYCKLLKRTIEALKQKRKVSFIETKIEIPFDAYLPEKYIAESSLRMEIYHRLGEAISLETAEEILKEIEDRFGKPTQEVIWLYHLSRIRIFASANQFTELLWKKNQLIAEQQLGDTRNKKTLLFPEKLPSPKAAEELLIVLLAKNFKILHTFDLPL